MKRFLVVFFALGLIVALGAPAAAADVKFSGEYYVEGYHDDNHDLGGSDTRTSDQFYAQRLRVGTEFQVAEGLKLVTRFDAMERVWGVGQNATYGAGGTAEGVHTRYEENIEWERAYVEFLTPVGLISAGYQYDDVWGTVFGDTASSQPVIRWIAACGPWTMGAYLTKNYEVDHGTAAADDDMDRYTAFFIYKFKEGDAGLQYRYYNYADASAGAAGYKQRFHLLTPYFKVKYGPAYIEGQLYHWFGDYQDYEASGATVDAESTTAYLMANVDLGPLYAGGQVGYAQGDEDAADATAKGIGNGGRDWNPCLILWNDNLGEWMGNLGTANTAGLGRAMTNAILYQVFAGLEPIEKLDVKASLTMATADQKPTGYVDDDYGNEFDITATYKVYDNLEYMVGFGYLWTGDYFKGTSAANKIDDNYILVNKLTLKF